MTDLPVMLNAEQREWVRAERAREMMDLLAQMEGCRKAGISWDDRLTQRCANIEAMSKLLNR